MSRGAPVRVARWLVAAIIAAGLLGIATASDAADNMTPELLQRFRDATENGQTTRVIVKYRWDAERVTRLPELLSPAQRRARVARRATLTIMRTRLITRVGASGRRTRGYRVLPFDGLRVSAAGLEMLLDDPDVESIHPDRLFRTTLASSVPVIDANDAHALGFTGAGQTVVIADTGVQASHGFLSNNDGSRIVSEDHNSPVIH